VGDVREFLDTVYVSWPRTTCVEAGYWEARKVGDTFEVVAVTREQEEQVVATGLAEADANFIAQVHTALPEVIRQAHTALDEADRADADRDEREQRIAALELERVTDG
jgi:hypothetical protein